MDELAQLFVSSLGSNTAPYETWAKAATSLQTALTAATSNGDIVLVQHDAVPGVDAELAASTNYTLFANIAIIAASNNGGSSWAPNPMGAANWIGNSTTSFAIGFLGAFRSFIFGLTLRVAAGGAASITVNSADAGHQELEQVYFWLGTGTNTFIRNGTNGSSLNNYTKFKNCTFRFGHNSQAISVCGAVDFVGGEISNDGVVPLNIFKASYQNSTVTRWIGGDLSRGVSSTLVGDSASSATRFIFDRCKLGAGATMLGNQLTGNKGSNSVMLLDCSSDETQGIFGYADALGTLTSDQSIYLTAGAAPYSWKIVTSSNCTRHTPFVAPLISKFHNGASPITPKLEVLRPGSTTPFQNDQVWVEFLAKVTGDSSKASYSKTEVALGGAPANLPAGVGTSAWVGATGADWSGRIQSSELNTVEPGAVSASLCVAVPDATLHVAPQLLPA